MIPRVSKAQLSSFPADKDCFQYTALPGFLSPQCNGGHALPQQPQKSFGFVNPPQAMFKSLPHDEMQRCAKEDQDEIL